MKRSILLVAASLFLVLVQGCDSDSGDDNSGNPAHRQIMSAKVDGGDWQVMNGTAERVQAQLRIFGSKATPREEISITLMNVTEPGAYTLGDGHLTRMTFLRSLGSPEPYLATSGTVTLTTVDTEFVKGTFAFEATRTTNVVHTVSITDGVFDVDYTFKF